MQRVGSIGKIAPLPWYFILLVSIVLIGHNAVNAYAGSTVYDFIAHAPEASWSSGSGVLPFPGNPADSRGFALFVDNALLEDGTTWKKVLETHPQWVSGGWIMGAYPQQTVQSNVQLTVRIGFLSGATGTDGARFDIYFDEYRGMNVAPLRYTILSQVATLDGRLDLVTKDLGYLAGKKGTFILYVNAGQTSGRDWAVWAEAKVETKALPDLVITNIWEKDGLIHYRVKNAGDAPTSAKRFCDALSVDGQQVAVDYIEIIIQPGQEVEGIFNYTWRPAPGQHKVRVCADVKQDVDESNEQNNCLEEEWVKENLPDLIITEVRCDRNNSLIGYVVKNIGGETAKGNHSTTLYVDGKEIAHDLVGVDLDPGDTYDSWFKEFEWPECHNITVKVCADNYDQVKESDEGNNCLERVCISYPVPILITYGPSAVNVTQDEATISWMTNKRSDSVVKYADRTTGEEKTAYDPSPVRNHQITLEGLEPRTTYRFYVASKDQCGNVVISKSRVFETESPPDEENPSVSLFLPERLVGVVNILANASDNVGVGGVMFSIDGVYKLIDFSPPYVWVCNTTLFANGIHGFDAKAFDAAGNEAVDVKNGTIDNPIPDTNPPTVTIVYPTDGEAVAGLVRIEARIQDLALPGHLAGHIREVEFYVDGVLIRRWAHTPFHFDVFSGEFVTDAPTSDLTLTCLWNATRLEPDSEHEIEVMGWDDSGNEGHASVVVTILHVEWIQPALEMIIVDVDLTRDVVRYGNWFDVSLTIRNIGNQPLDHFVIRDQCLGFQAIALPMPSTSMDTEVSYHDWMYSEVVITPLMGTLNPRESWTFHYYVVPILFRPRLYDDAYIIGFYTYVNFQSGTASCHRTFELPRAPAFEDVDANGRDDLNDAFESADYLIVTNPRKLFEFNPDDRDGVDLLLQEAAVLAKVKSGILGYLNRDATKEEFRGLIAPGGDWASRLGNEFAHPERERAYLLIIGEDDIVPAWRLPCPGFFPSYTGGYIDVSDYKYADVTGDERPELRVGRVIGNNAREVMNVIQSSLDVSMGSARYDGSDILLVSGPDDTWEANVKATEGGRTTLGRMGIIPVIVHTDYWTTHWRMFYEALRIKGTANGGAAYDADLSGFTERQLAAWILASEGLLPSGITKDYAMAHADTVITDDLFNRALRRAEQIQANRDNRGGSYGWTYVYYPTDWDAEVSRNGRVKFNAPDKDIIFFVGHGDPGGWCAVLDDWGGTSTPITPINFGSSHPVVLAFTCLSGDYNCVLDDGRNPSIAKAFFKNHAAVYIGSTEVSCTGDNEATMSELFWRYWTRDTRIGDAHFELRENRIGAGWIYYVYEYNLYGDPKFGG